MIGCDECECFGAEGTIGRDIRYKSSEVGWEAVVTETESTDGHIVLREKWGEWINHGLAVRMGWMRL